MQFLVKAGLAGVYIGFAVAFAFKTGDLFLKAGSPAYTLMAGMTFSLALILIVIGGVDLFTGNNMYMAMGTLAKKTTVKDMLAVWGATWIGNLLGVFLFVFLFMAGGVFDGIGTDHYLITAAEGKANLTTTQMFFRGILCNWLVCLAVWLPLQTKNFAAKVMLIIICVTAFFATGYEHSVANMAVFSLALLLPHPDTITIFNTLHNLVVVTFGNLIGGAVFVGAAYVFINRKVKVPQKKVSVVEKKVDEQII